MSIRKLFIAQRRQRCLRVVGMLLALWSAPAANAQEADDAPPDRARTERIQTMLEAAKRAPGKVLTRGTNKTPVGKLRVKTYRLEEIELPEPIEFIERGEVKREESIIRLTVTGERFPPGSYTIWIGDDWPLDAVDKGIDELSIVINSPDLILEEGAVISVSRGSGCRRGERTMLPDVLTVPAQMRTKQKSLDHPGNFVQRIGRWSGAVVGGTGWAIEIELASAIIYPIRNQIMVLQIGEEEFPQNAEMRGKKLIFRLTQEEWERAPDGGRVKVKFGRCTPGGNRYGSLDKSMLDK